MSKLSFRARALDASKPLPVFRCEDLPDLHEYASINRAVPQMPTGMEKEEESEHHLQRAISAHQVYGEKRENMVIPVPEAESNIPYYDSLYPGEFKMPKQLIHIQPFSLDTEQPDYDLDSDDDMFVNKLKKKMELSQLQFEEMIDRLEKGSGQQLVSLPEAKLLLKEDDELIKEVFDYWSRKRKNSKANSLIPTVKQEKRDGSSTNDPYVAFRRRTEKMQTRKNRKNDEASYEKMLKLRRDLSRAVTILEMVKRREKSKRELLHLTLEVFEKRNFMSDFGGEVMAEVLAEQALVRPQIIPLVPLTNQYRHQDHVDHKDYKSKPDKMEVPRQKRKYEKKQKVLPLSSGASHHQGPAVFNAKDLNQYDFPSSDDEPFSQLHSGSSEAEEENDPDGAYAFRRKSGCQYYAPRQDCVGGWPWCGPGEDGLAEARFRYSLTTLTVPRRCLGMARRRVGRGGRVLLDRAHTDYDNIFHGLDPEVLHPTHPPSPRPLTPPPTTTSRSPATDKFASTSETNTSDRISSSFDPSLSSPSSTDLSQILLSIKACRWRHFRPRTLPLHELDNAHPIFRKLSRGLKRRVSASIAGGQPYQRPARAAPAPAPIAAYTYEQYQQHQEQLSLMHKQQLEQVQLQQVGSSTTTNASHSLAHTLDQAKAQFAASALITVDQLLALKTKEEFGPGGGVNGVLSPSGVYKGLHLASTASPSPAAAAPPITTPTPMTLHPCTTTSSASSTSNNGTAHPTNTTITTATTTQVLLGNNSLRLGVPTGKRVHAPRTLSSSVSTSALKLAHAATANCQKPKVANATPLDIVPRENHEQDKPALNSLSENTMAMEVT
ncbi:enhancer of polycomb homolog 1b isoform X2 [Takifugu rubripes]|uniref:enhancer of polycomb homolog 1b isoform X2 n=1 Tax=Takifugu rubripes TaxID=31033 RepID=UPI0005D2B55A|nr:enhancer of polycomb homolog 1-like isoform X2 [Takifugu rubripes]|eukprot:XP_011615044.1 PREDICTED: enhancer of polycomb homolog 1-like isoform X2 [Takifugu rubripes]